MVQQVRKAREGTHAVLGRHVARAAELEIRDAVASKRNRHRQIATPDGRVDLSRLNTFTKTCYKNDILPCRAAVKMAHDPKWDLFNPWPWTARGWCIFDSPPAALVRPPDMDQLLVAVA